MIEIKNRYTGRTIRTVEADNLSGADLSGADLSGADLRGANLRGANLRYADLRGANLRGADLRGADLRGAGLGYADLGYADLGYADLSGANLGYANLGYANLRGANLRGANLGYANLPPIPVVEQLDAKILAAIEAGGNLEVANWHTCETTHCRYGWAITLAGEAGRVLEGQVGPLTAGALIYWKSAGHIPAYIGDNEAVLEDIRTRAAAAAEAQS